MSPYRLIRLTLVAAFTLPVAALYAETPAASAPATSQASTNADETRFMRFVADGTTGGKLETADVTYKNDAGVTVRLVSAVHIGEAGYYHAIQKSVEGCDAVLYEMVKTKDAPPPLKGQHSDHAVAKLQTLLKDTLGLSYQLDEIDYTPKNFVHADMDAETFSKLQSQRGESFAGLFLQSLMKAMTDPGAMQKTYDGEPQDVMDLMTRPDGENQLKLILARRLGDIEREASGMDMLNGTVILTERNKAVTKAIKHAVDSGKKNIAVFYGAAHMTELSFNLDLMGFKPTQTEWRTAWYVKVRPDAPSAFMKLMGHLQQQLQEAQ
jgi:hypothetical protein